MLAEFAAIDETHDVQQEAIPVIEETLSRSPFGNMIMVGTASELEFLKSQEWLAKLVWAVYKLTPTGPGFQDEIRETGKAMAAQARIQNRKAVFPLLRPIEQIINNQIINEFSPRIKFQFNFVGKEEEYADTQLEMQELSRAMITMNEWIKKRRIGPPVR